MGYEQALTRAAELRALTGAGPIAPAAASGVDSASSAAFRAHLDAQLMSGAMGSGSGDVDAGGLAGTTGGALDTNAMAQMLMASMQGGGTSAASLAGSPVGAGGVPVITAEALKAYLGAAVPAAAPPAAPTRVSGDLDGLNPELLAALDAIGAELGQEISVRSGFRTYEEQAELYQQYLNGTGNLAAPPGSSNHEDGNAADVNVGGTPLASVPGAAAVAARHGVHFPVGGEPWHAELR